MATQHTVQQGEHLLLIAEQYGFADYRSIWESPGNAELRLLRKNPNVLLPGDILTIPDKSTRTAICRTGAFHVFVMKRRKAKLRLRILDFFREPMAGAACSLMVAGVTTELTADGDGMIEQEIPVSARRATLVANEMVFEILIGHLDPEDQPTGLQERLNNLGYPRQFQEANEEIDWELLRFSTELFERDHELAVAGEATPALVEEVRRAHGS